MSDGAGDYAAKIPAGPSTLARVAQDLSDSRNRLDSAATDLETLADRLCGPLPPQPATDGTSLASGNQPSGSVNLLDVLATGLSRPAARIEDALNRIGAAIG